MWYNLHETANFCLKPYMEKEWWEKRKKRRCKCVPQHSPARFHLFMVVQHEPLYWVPLFLSTLNWKTMLVRAHTQKIFRNEFSSRRSDSLCSCYHRSSPPQRRPLHLLRAFFCIRMGEGLRLQCGRGKTQYLASNIRLCNITTGWCTRRVSGEGELPGNALLSLPVPTLHSLSVVSSPLPSHFIFPLSPLLFSPFPFPFLPRTR